MQTSALGTGDGGVPVAILAAPPPPGPSYDYPPPDYDEPTGAPMDNMNALDVREEGFIHSNSKYQYRWLFMLHGGALCSLIPLSLLPLTPPSSAISVWQSISVTLAPEAQKMCVIGHLAIINGPTLPK